MSTIQQDVEAIRRKLSYPPRSVLDDGEIAAALFEVDDELVTELNLTSQFWFAPRFILTVSPDKDVYSLNPPAGDFGRAGMVITYDSGNTNHAARSVRMVDEPQLIVQFSGGQKASNSSKHSAEAVAFFYKDGQQYIRFGPIPQQTAQYQIVYEPDVVHGTSKTSSGFRLPQFAGYRTDRAAFKLLPYAGLDEVMYQRLLAILSAEVGRGDLRFRRYKASDRQTNPFRSVPFGARRRRGRI